MNSPRPTLVARGRHITTGRAVEIRWRNGRIVALKPVAKAPANRWLAPALVDLQVNGYAGVDFQQDDLSAEELLVATRALRADGCATYLLTLVTDTWPRLVARLRHLRQLRAGSPELQDSIAGWHVEGPFLSDRPGYCGAHDPSVMCDPTTAHLRELREVTGKDPVLLTLAPERAGAVKAIRCAASLGFKVSLGHTNASADELRAAMKAGATGFTHLGNACPRELDRHDNIVWRVLDTPRLTVGLIADGIHVSPELFRLVHRALPPRSIYHTTDAMSAAGAPPGRYRLGRLELEVGADQIVRQPGRTNFAGSALRPIEGVRRAASMLGRSWRDVWPHFSQIPARWMGLSVGLRVGGPAKFVVVEESADGISRLLEPSV